MARKKILTSTDHKGVHEEGIAAEAMKPGQAAIENATALVSGRSTFEPPDLSADGDKTGFAIVLEDRTQGGTITDSYATGERLFLYYPALGEKINVLVQASAGALVKGDLLILDDDTGDFIKTTGSPGSEPFEVLEASSDSASDRHVLCRFVGH